MHETIKKLIMAGAIALLLVTITPELPVTAQKQAPVKPCEVGHNAAAIGFWTWPASTHVNVYVRRGDFRPDELPYLLKPLREWSSVSQVTTSGVIFDYAGTTDEQLTCEKCLTIMRGSVFDKTKRHVTETQAYSVHRDQLIAYAMIIIDPSLTNPEALSNAIAHELGHNLGLLDCYRCARNSTLMTGFKGLNIPNAVTAPTNCDIGQVREAYTQLRVQVRPSPTVTQIDRGEEPVDDDTPIIVPKPR
jgi:hypothetical protein